MTSEFVNKATEVVRWSLKDYNIFHLVKENNLISLLNKGDLIELSLSLVLEALNVLSKNYEIFENKSSLKSSIKIEVSSQLNNLAISEQAKSELDKFLFGEETIGFIDTLFIEENLVDRNIVLDYINQIIHEREIKPTLRKSDSLDRNQIYEFVKNLYQKELKLLTLGNIPQIDVLAEIQSNSITKYTTGIAFLDEMLCGGYVPTGIYGFLGGYGSGKTMLACQLAVSLAKLEAEIKDMQPNYQPKLVYLFYYEGLKHEISSRIIANACEISWQSLLTAKQIPLSTTSDQQTWKEYEYQYFGNYIKANLFKAEKERLALFERIRNIIKVFDMSATPQAPHRGTGYIDEIVSIIEATKQNNDIKAVIVDYVGILARRHLAKLEEELNRPLLNTHLRHKIGMFPHYVYCQISSKYNCPVFLMHQLSTMANKEGFKIDPHHAWSAEAGNFAENLTAALNLGIKHPEHPIVKFSITKHRFGPHRPMKLLRINEIFCRLEPASKAYRLDQEGDLAYFEDYEYSNS